VIPPFLLPFLLIPFALVAVWFLWARVLAGESQARWQHPRPEPHVDLEAPSPQHEAAVRRLEDLAKGAGGGSLRGAGLQALRARVDALGDTLAIDAEVRPVDAGGVPAEWVLAPGADPGRRLLYLHGGAFVLGSPRSHRAITARLSAITGASVLAIDYRLVPEHPRLACVEDCRTAWRWVVEHGPDGSAPVDTLLVAGDSAGGNLALVTLAWARDAGVRQADAAIALSPGTDSTLGSPSLRDNAATDPMLGPLFGRIARLPRSLNLWFAWLGNRVRPSHPDLSPLHGPLHDLPPTLVHASLAEMLLDDAVRYANKARAAGSPVTLQTWPHVLHVWHLFVADGVPEAQQAFDAIGAWVEEVLRTREAAAA
jgi:monoterpene epsilon-lactone hydrolase